MPTTPIRCAVYTRKSTEEGLEQAFNSLDAQRESCEAYIASQTHEGWTLAPGDYDDGGYSGGNMDRPALLRLLDEVKAGRVDVIIVYKVDRLTRNLSDFARIVEVLDKAGASFVSVTQAFNTTTSMGRLTLNVLLSFAQFEREVTGERIRDKIAASKAKGMWMGGVVPLGYDVVDRKLAINAAEADQVRHIFQRYVALGSVLTLQAELDAQGITSKVRHSRAGNVTGGASMSRGALYQLLQNPLYIGKVAHRGNVYDGEHDAIVDQELFDTVQQILAENRVDAASKVKAVEPSPFAGRIWDGDGRRMSPSHTTRRGRRYRYYVSRPETAGATPLRIPAGDLEGIVVDALTEFLKDQARVHDAIAAADPTAQQIQAMISTAANMAEALISERSGSVLTTLVERVTVGDATTEVSVNPATLSPCSAISLPSVSISVATKLDRVGREMKLIVPAANCRVPDPALVKLIVKAFAAREAVEQNPKATIAELAEAQGHKREYFGVLLRLSYMAPSIQSAILAGDQPIGLTRQKLARFVAIPFGWVDQQKAFGFTC
ncbi:MAG: recombinase family protein [Sphingomonas sp.]|uniref:recombinase family protein n=1 Tax=Sphingomonas sp. TaxID=28214 RepID=UPI003F813655